MAWPSSETELSLATLAEALADVSAGRVEYFEDFDAYLTAMHKL